MRERNVSREFARQHMHHHVDLDDYVHRAYAKTHPDALKTLEQCRKGCLGWPEPITDEDPHAFIDRIFSKDLGRVGKAEKLGISDILRASTDLERAQWMIRSSRRQH